MLIVINCPRVWSSAQFTVCAEFCMVCLCACGFPPGSLASSSQIILKCVLNVLKLPLGENESVNICVHGALRCTGVLSKLYSHLMPSVPWISLQINHNSERDKEVIEQLMHKLINSLIFYFLNAIPPFFFTCGLVVMAHSG